MKIAGEMLIGEASCTDGWPSCPKPLARRVFLRRKIERQLCSILSSLASCATRPTLGRGRTGRDRCVKRLTGGVCLSQVTATRRRAAPSSTAAMQPPRRASSTTRSTWRCLRYGCSHTPFPPFSDGFGGLITVRRMDEKLGLMRVNLQHHFTFVLRRKEEN